MAEKTPDEVYTAANDARAALDVVIPAMAAIGRADLTQQAAYIYGEVAMLLADMNREYAQATLAAAEAAE